MWVKREDAFAINGVNGSKVRSLWYLAHDAAGLVAYGSRHSPHGNRVAHVAQAFGIPCHLHIAGGALLPEYQMAERASAHIFRHTPGYMTVIAARAREDAKQHGYYLVPFGVVCREAVQHVIPQVTDIPDAVQRIVMAVGSGITLAGLLHGLQHADRHIPVLGVCVGKSPLETLTHYAPQGWQSQVSLVASSLPYEKPAPNRWRGLVLDPIYEAKCVPFLRAGDLLWIIGVRSSALAEVTDQMPRSSALGDGVGMPLMGDSSAGDSTLDADTSAKVAAQF